jgi:ParB family chromosome partitioning protein
LEVLTLSTSTGDARAIVRIPLFRIQENPDRPRRDCGDESVARLADSIRLHGLLSPLLVRQLPAGRYELVAGTRRLLALRLLNRASAETIVLTGSPCDCALIALVENLQREPLHFLDVAAACRAILDRYPITQERLAASLSISPSALANRLRLLRLPPNVQDAVRRNGLSERHARALLRLTCETDQLSITEQAAQKRLSVAQLEKQVELMLSKPLPSGRRLTPALRDSRMIVNALLGTVRQLTRIGVPVQSKVEEGDGCVRVIVTIPAAEAKATKA